MPIFSRAEMDRRHQALRAALRTAELDGVVATSYPAFYFLSGSPLHPYGRPMAILVPRDESPVIIESYIEWAHTKRQSWITDIRVYWDYNPTPTTEHPRPPLASMVHHLRDAVVGCGLGGKRVGIEEATLPVAHLNAFEAAMPGTEFVPASALLDRLRLVKSPEELALIRAADAVSDLGQQTALELIRPGRTADELNAEIRNVMAEACFRDYPDMPFHIHADVGLGAIEKNAGHSEWTTWGASNRVEPGQVLATVFSVWLWGYSGNVERAVSVGEPSPRRRELFELMVEMNEAAIDAVRPGVAVAEIDRICKSRLAERNLVTPTGTGVGRGITSYEANARELELDIRLYNDVVLAPGMAFSIEPHVREGDVVFRHCNTIIVTENGCEVDSRTPRGVLCV